jgi:hypothetical protein
MKTRIGMMLVLVLIFAGCTRQGDQSTTQEAEQPAVQKEALESKQEALPEEAAKTGEEDPDVKRCLELVNQAKFDDALPVCLEALKKDPSNEQVQEAVKSAQASVGDAVAAGEEAAKDAKEAADEKVQGAMEQATGSMAP